MNPMNRSDILDDKGEEALERQVEEMMQQYKPTIQNPADDPKTVDRWAGELVSRLRFAESENVDVGQRVLGAFTHWRKKLLREVKAHATNKLNLLVGKLADRFEATSAWLFEKDEPDRLIARITHNTQFKNLILKIEGQECKEKEGIVVHVARTGYGYYCSDVSRDPWYLQKDASSRSELAVPLLRQEGPPRNRLLGVLNLESCVLGAFNAARITELQAAACELTPHLLVLAGLRAWGHTCCPWHPEIHGWDLVRICERLCQVVAKSLDEHTTECQIWYPDWAKEELFIYSTTGYDAEYADGDTLPIDSFTGSAARNPQGVVEHGGPSDSRFVRKNKATVRGLKQIRSIPIYSLEPGRSKKALAAFNVYFFDKRAQSAIPADSVLGRLAKQIGKLIVHYDTQRRELGAAYLHHKLRDKPRASDDDFATIRDVLEDVFQADGVHIFAQHPDKSELICAATTGLQVKVANPDCDQLGGSNIDGTFSPIVYQIDEKEKEMPTGYVTFLALRRPQCIRKNDMPNFGETGVPRGLPPIYQDKYRDKFARSDSDHRRFLGVPVVLPSEKVGSAGDVLGVICVVRASRSKPFTRCDGFLLRRMAEVCRESFELWRDKVRTFPPDQDVTAANTTDPVNVHGTPRLISTAVASFMRRYVVNDRIRPKQSINELLQDLVAVYREQNVLQASVLLHNPDSQNEPFKVFAYHSEKHRIVPGSINGPDKKYAPHKTHDVTLWQSILNANKIVTFSDDHFAADNDIVAGIRVPIRVYDRQLIEAIVSMDFLGPVDWTCDDARILCYAARKLAAIWSSNPRCFAHVEGRNAVERASELPQASLNANWTTVLLRMKDKLIPIQESKRHDPSRQWVSIDRTIDSDAASLGVQWADDQRAWSIPLLLGPLDAGRVCFGFDDFLGMRDSPRGWHAFRDKGRELIGQIAGDWARSTIGSDATCEVHFQSSSVNRGVQWWGGEIIWAESLLGRN